MQEITLEVTNSPQLFNWKEYGLKLNIPEQSLPSNVNSCKITITVSFFGMYQFPEDTELVSPLFWLRCEPHCKLAYPWHLEIEHCAPQKNTQYLCMARAASSQKSLPYTFKELQGGIFSEFYSYGSIDFSSFGGVGVFQKWSKERRYWFILFYMTETFTKDIHFAITWNDSAHIKVS